MSLIQPRSSEENRVLHQCLFIAGGLVLLDQFSKLLIVGNFEQTEKVPVIPDFFNIVYFTNKGAAWGMFSDHSRVLFVVSIVVFALIIYFIRTLCEGVRERYYAVAMISSGIAGNLIDRIWRHHVVDFLDFHVGERHWPAFNVADSAITIGVIVYIISNVFRSMKQRAQTDGRESDAKRETTSTPQNGSR